MTDRETVILSLSATKWKDPESDQTRSINLLRNRLPPGFFRSAQFALIAGGADAEGLRVRMTPMVDVILSPNEIRVKDPEG